MSKRFQAPIFQRILKELDPGAVSGKRIRSLGLDERIFDGKPGAHTAGEFEFCQVYEFLEKEAREDNRLAAGVPLIQSWRLGYDIYSPRLVRFIEVDEYQHFSRVRLNRILENRRSAWKPLYPDHFWNQVVNRLLDKPYRDLCPPHRDEQRAYRDEMRERLPVLYGLRNTMRIDEFTLKEIGLARGVNLIQQIIDCEEGKTGNE